jgi:threonine dehydratase
MMRKREFNGRMLRKALERIRPHVMRTPTLRHGRSRLWLKCENRQVTGSFKVRGAINKVLSLGGDALARGLVAASAGNHGLGVAYAAKLASAKATLVLPEGAVKRKVEAIKALGAQVVLTEGGYAGAEKEGKLLADRVGACWISPYNDIEVIGGQGTVGVEITEQLGFEYEGDQWEMFVPVGGGGLVSGIGIAMRDLAEGVRVIGIQPEASPYMHAHFQGMDMAEVAERETLADGLAGAVEEESITLLLVPRLVDDMALMTEEQIEDAIRWAAREAGEKIEPSAAVALAGWRACGTERKAVVVLSGGNIDESLSNRLMPEDR